MKLRVIFAVTVTVISFVEADSTIEFFPSLLIESQLFQKIENDVEVGSLFIDVAEIGFEMVYGEKVGGAIVLEYSDGEAAFGEASITYAVNSNLSLTAGQFVNNFANIESDGIFFPLIIDFTETNAAAVQLDFNGDILYGGVSVYQGVINESFQSFVPAIGFNFNDIVDVKLSSRIELLNEEFYADISSAITICPTELLTIRGELYIETKEKEVDVGNILGYYGEASFAINENWSALARLDQIINDINTEPKSGTLLIHGGAGYQIVEPLKISVATGAASEQIDGEHNFTPLIVAELTFEL